MDTKIISLISIISTGISALATAAMVILTWKTLQQNKGQLDELKKQWEEQNKPKIIPSLIKSGHSVYLRIKNYSNTSANNVKVVIKKNSIIDIDWHDEFENKFNNTLFNIEPFGYKDILLIYTDWSETSYKGELIIKILINKNDSSIHNLNLSELNLVSKDISNEKIVSAIKGISDKLERGIQLRR